MQRRSGIPLIGHAFSYLRDIDLVLRRVNPRNVSVFLLAPERLQDEAFAGSNVFPALQW